MGLRLRCVYRHRGPNLLTDEGQLNTKGRSVASRSKTARGVVTATIYLLVPPVKLPKRREAVIVASNRPGPTVPTTCGGPFTPRIPGHRRKAACPVI